ncbi:MAG: DUF5658 family protein [Nitrospirota bacterium]
MYSLSDRRIVSDRRKHPTPFISKYTFIGGRRKIIRRQADKKKYVFVDLYESRLFVTLLFLLILSLCDGYFTIALSRENFIVEANPVMAFYLEWGHVRFILSKFLITSVTCIIFCLCKNFSITKFSLGSMIIIYIGIMIYELNLIYKFGLPF